MKHGKFTSWDNDALVLRTVDGDHPLPVARLGEALSTFSQATFDSGYGLIPGTVIDTGETGAKSVAYQIAVEANDVNIKIVGAVALGTTRWYGALETFDETGLPRGSDHIATLHDDDVALFLVSPGALSTYRYFGVMHAPAVNSAIGYTAVKGFSK